MGILSPRPRAFKSIDVDEHAAIDKMCCNETDEATIAKWVLQLKGLKGSSTVDRLLVVTSFRVMTLKRKTLNYLSISKNYSLLELKSLDIETSDEGVVILQLQFANSKTLRFNTDTHAESYVRCIQRSLSQIQQNFTPDLSTQIHIPAALHWEEYPEHVNPFQSFINTYKAFCNHYNAPYRPSVPERLQDMCQGIDLPGIDFEYCFQKCRNPSAGPKDALALIGALRTSQLFASVTVKEFPIDEAGVIALFAALQYNHTVQGIQLSKVQLTKEALDHLQMTARAQNIAITTVDDDDTGGGGSAADDQEEEEMLPQVGLKELDLSNNHISRDMATSLAIALKTFKNGLQMLGLEGCRMTYGALAPVIASIRLPAWTSSLRELNLSRNQLGKEGSTALADWISCSFALQRLHLASTQLDSAAVLSALRCNSVLHRSSLGFLDISDNKMTLSGAQALGDIMIATASLCDLKICGTQLNKAHLAHILRPLFRNSCEKMPFSIDLSDNDLSGARGRLVAQLIAESPMARRERLVMNNCNMGDDIVSLRLVLTLYLTSTTVVCQNCGGSAAMFVLACVIDRR